MILRSRNILKTVLTAPLGRFARPVCLGLMLALAGGVGLPSALALSAESAQAAGDVRYAGDGSMIVRLPGGGESRLDAVTANRIRGAMRRESDAAAEAALEQIMMDVGRHSVPAVAVAAANIAPSRAALISAVAVNVDSRAGLDAARALPYVRGVRNDQVLLGVHASGNRAAYRQLRSDFSAQNADAARPAAIGRAAAPDPDRRGPAPLGIRPRILP